jgi:hypothetical protein
MLSEDEKRFLQYWENNREREKKTFRQLVIGLPIGLSFAIGIMVLFTAGWYQRAEMEAHTQSSPIFFLVALVAIISFVAIFSKKHKWDMNEQQYKELLHKQQKEHAAENASK